MDLKWCIEFVTDYCDRNITLIYVNQKSEKMLFCRINRALVSSSKWTKKHCKTVTNNYVKSHENISSMRYKWFRILQFYSTQNYPKLLSITEKLFISFLDVTTFQRRFFSSKECRKSKDVKKLERWFISVFFQKKSLLSQRSMSDLSSD